MNFYVRCADRWISYFALFVFLACHSLLFADDQPALPERLLTLWAGSLPIVISAPHGGRESVPGVSARQGAGVAQFVTGRDTATDELAELIAANLARNFTAKPHLIVARFERKYIDANRPSSSAYESQSAKTYYDAYHHALAEACRRVRLESAQGLLLDIHGEGSDAEAIFRGTNNGQTVTALTRRFGHEALGGAQSIAGQLAQKGYKVFPANGKSDRENRYSGGFIVQTYGSHTRDGIDAIQFEFGTALRRRALLHRTATDVADAVSVFARAYLPALR